MYKSTNLTVAYDLCTHSQKITKFELFTSKSQANMSKFCTLCLIFCCFYSATYAGNGIKSIAYINEGSHASRFNIKVQPAIYWSSIGLEAEYVVSAKASLAINIKC